MLQEPLTAQPIENNKEEVRRQLSHIIANALRLYLADVDPYAPFMEMGASSLALVDAFRDINQTFGVRPAIRKVIDEYDCVDRLADYILELQAAQTAVDWQDLAAQRWAEWAQKNGREYSRLPLTAGQRHLWFLARYSEGAMLAHTHRLIWQLDGPLDSALLQAALQEVASRHEALRISFDTAEEELRRGTAVAVTLEEVDLSSDTKAVAAWLREESQRPFEASQSLWRVALLHLSQQRHLLVLTAHALIADPVTLHRLLTEVAAIYSARQFGNEPVLDEPLSFREYAGWLEQQALRPEYEQAQVYWSQQYADGIPQLDLPLWHIRPPVKQYDGARLVSPLAEETAAALQARSQAEKVTPFSTLLAAFQAWLHRLSGQTDLVVGVFNRGTLLRGTEPLIANNVNPLPLRNQVDPEQSFAAHVRRVQQSLIAAFDHQDYPFAALINDLNPARDTSRSAIFTVALDWERETTPSTFAGLTTRPVTPPISHVPYDLTLTLREVNGQSQLQCDYSSELFDAPTMRRWLTSFKTLLAACLTTPETPLYALPIMTDEERRQILVEWNDTAVSHPQDQCFHQLIEKQAQKTPDAVAVFDKNGRLTYAELDRRANQLAHYLQKMGVGTGVFVGISLDRSVAMMVGLLGILKAGAAYVPMDPAYPRERLAFMLADSQAPVLITESGYNGRFATYQGKILCLDQLTSTLAQEAETAPPLPAGPSDNVYLIYTSGSTGLPKGVQLTHHNVINLAQHVIETMPITAADIALATTSLSFDVAVTELYLPLMAGGQVAIVPQDEVADALALTEWLQRSRATIMQATPSHWQMLLDAGWQGSPSLKLLSIGEPLPYDLARRLLQCGHSLGNWYGPTETTIYSTSKIVSAGDTEITIGRPVANTQIYLLDRQMQPVPIGVPGEMYIGGDGVSPGYWQRPELNAERFVNYELRITNYEEDDTRPLSLTLYRTGDLARYRPDGELDFLGRVDQQVKVKGFRIELGEIETVLNRHPAVDQSVVVALDDAKGLKYLAAYFVPAASEAVTTTVTTSELRAFLAETLPDYMIPLAFVVLEALPLTPNGKTDRNALPAPDAELRAGWQRNYAPPRNRVEEILVKIWCEVLDLEQVGIYDSFFDLGGHSLLLTPLVLKLRDYFQLRLSMREFFERPTIAELAEMIAVARGKQQGADNAALVATLPQEGPEVRARFDFLRQEAQLDPAIGAADTANGRIYDPHTPLQHIFMTGGTGFVGAYIIHNFMETSDVSLHCLVRAADETAGLRRIRQQMENLGLWRDGYQERIGVVIGDVSQPRLGLDEETYHGLAGTVDAILHSAAMVNFIYPYQALKPVNVTGTQHIIQFAFSGKVKPVHYVSTTAVWPMGSHRSFNEDDPLDQELRLNLAYDETKWVAEKMLGQAAERGLPVAIYRPGEVSGDSRTGFSDLSHLASAFVKGNLQAGIFPALDSFLDLTPVDYVGEAIAHLMTRTDPLGHIYHLCNPQSLHARDTYDWLLAQGYQFDVLAFDEWRWRILSAEDFAENALYPFAAILEEFAEHNLQLPLWDTTRAKESLAAIGVHCPPVDGRLLRTYMDYYVKVGFVPAPEASR
jgi:myxalamid-type nonribosomal peptide synthetase MxaA